ncbi:MAG: DUF2147 domain-containing protein [Flavipsychrobacter sp.]
MPIKNIAHLSLLFVLALLSQVPLFAQSGDPLLHLWYNEEKNAKIEIYKGKDDRYYGKVVWLKVPTVDGKPKTDIHNSDEKKRNQPIIGLVILKGIKKVGDNDYEEGTVYDPKNGSTYKCKMSFDGDKLNLRGYIGFSWIGRTTTWTKAE